MSTGNQAPIGTASAERPMQPETAKGGAHCVQRLVRPGHRWVFTKPACPYCGGKLTASVNGWYQEPDGWIADDVQLDCENDDEKHEDHCYMPYENWLPVEQRILRWINARYRWQLEGPNG